MGNVTYYSALRPISIGTYPKPEGTKVVSIEHFVEGRRLINNEFLAWGSITYDRPLDEAVAYRYDLVQPKAYPPEFLERTLGSLEERIVKRARRLLLKQGFGQDEVEIAQGLPMKEVSDLLGGEFLERAYVLQKRFEGPSA